MRVKVNKAKEFTPIELTLVIESEAELYELWHRFNISTDKVKEGSSGFDRISYREVRLEEAWSGVNALVRRHQGET